ncbi:MAG: heme-copper oxidase subunit III [Chloroflexota bacterium]|nr:heme-copper oxidase subunit III [Chloroflexota bacterium]
MSVAHDEATNISGHPTEGRSLAWWGMIFFIASEALIFANLIAAFLYLEIQSNGRGAPWRLPTGEKLDWVYPLINTIILIASSLPVRIAGAGIARNNQTRLRFGLLGTIILGAVFLGGQLYEYTNLFVTCAQKQCMTVSYGAFGSAFFTLTGFHGLHVTVGVIFLLICLIRSFRGDFTAKNHFAVQAAEMYWHFVDVVWIVVFSVVYLLPLIRG